MNSLLETTIANHFRFRLRTKDKMRDWNMITILINKYSHHSILEIMTVFQPLTENAISNELKTNCIFFSRVRQISQK